MKEGYLSIIVSSLFHTDCPSHTSLIIANSTPERSKKVWTEKIVLFFWLMTFQGSTSQAWFSLIVYFSLSLCLYIFFVFQIYVQVAPVNQGKRCDIVIMFLQAQTVSSALLWVTLSSNSTCAFTSWNLNTHSQPVRACLLKTYVLYSINSRQPVTCQELQGHQIMGFDCVNRSRETLL